MYTNVEGHTYKSTQVHKNKSSRGEAYTKIIVHLYTKNLNSLAIKYTSNQVHMYKCKYKYKYKFTL